jgi:dolichyl-diphosphooligosaccharide--protein glycosyltransferase
LIDNATLIDWQIKKMAYSLITTPDNSWQILNSHYSEDVSDYIGNENVKAWKGIPIDEFQNNYTTKQFFDDPNLTYEILSEDEKNSVDNYITQNGHIECKTVFKKEAKELGVREESCNPVTKGMDADYILIFVATERFAVPNSSGFLYLLDGGADESKKVWFMKISNHEPSKFVESDNMTPTSYFMENSTLGKLMPFSIYKYVEPGTDRIYDEYRHGFIPIYLKDIKYLDPENDPFYLVYASPTFYSDIPGPMTSVLIYKINSDYKP